MNLGWLPRNPWFCLNLVYSHLMVYHFFFFIQISSSHLDPDSTGSDGFRGATGRVALTNVDAASGSVPVPLQRLGPFDDVLVDAPCTSVTWAGLDLDGVMCAIKITILMGGI